jgi:hypothetical protein
LYNADRVAVIVHPPAGLDNFKYRICITSCRFQNWFNQQRCFFEFYSKLCNGERVFFLVLQKIKVWA